LAIVRLNPRKIRSQTFFLVVVISNDSQGGNKLARSNYQFNKRQKELARKKKKEEKRQLKLNKNTLKSEDDENQSQDEEETL
jgi:hypothetical protein